jgi:hypothetical protein
MNAVRSVARLVVVPVVGLALVAGCTGPDTPKPTTTTTTTTPGPFVGQVKDFVAWENREPPGPAQLIITGTVIVPSPAYAARLVPASPQGFNPRILLLHLEIVRTTDRPVPQVLVARPVRLEASPNYDRVTILEAGLDIPVAVTH